MTETGTVPTVEAATRTANGAEERVIAPDVTGMGWINKSPNSVESFNYPPLNDLPKQLWKAVMDIFKGLIDRATVELLDELFPPRAPDPKDTEREVWMKAGERRLVDWLILKLAEQEDQNLVPLQP